MMSPPKQPPTQGRDIADPVCPARKTAPAAGLTGPPVEHLPGQRCVVRSFQVGRRVLRDSTALRQAGFGADQVSRTAAKIRPPILYLEGTEHRRQRHATARFFAPKVIESHREMMESLSQECVARVRRTAQSI